MCENTQGHLNSAFGILHRSFGEFAQSFWWVLNLLELLSQASPKSFGDKHRINGRNIHPNGVLSFELRKLCYRYHSPIQHVRKGAEKDIKIRRFFFTVNISAWLCLTTYTSEPVKTWQQLCSWMSIFLMGQVATMADIYKSEITCIIYGHKMHTNGWEKRVATLQGERAVWTHLFTSLHAGCI